MTTPTERALQREIDRLNSVMRQQALHFSNLSGHLADVSTNLSQVVATTATQTYLDAANASLTLTLSTAYRVSSGGVLP